MVAYSFGTISKYVSTSENFMPLNKFEIICYIKSNSFIQMNIEISATPLEMFSAYFEKMVNTLLFKLFNRVKHFIYNINYVNNNKI